MESVYQPREHEEKIYSLWENGGYFTPKIDPKKKPFVITLPPPNVTGGLHAGHAMYVIEDIMVRFHRMLGDPTLWLPGFDHASIAVEYLVCKQLAKEGLTKQKIGREEFLKRATKFAEDSRDYIREQMKKTGFSLDWSREAYTMDETRTAAVKEAFSRLYEEGLIYKGERIVNWCPKCKTAISDLENVYEEEPGKLYFVKYGPITIATTRPETMFADVAIAIHPKNKKFKSLIGQLVPLPLTDRKIPVIEDEAVDPEFGTGALKITPAHDELDFEIGGRHQLESLVAIDSTGRLTALAGKYAGLSAKEARKMVVEDLQKGGYLEKVEDYLHDVGHCQRCGTITEPLPSLQWFVKTKPLAQKAIEVVKKGQIKILPRRFEKVYFHWLENIRDWCISRQLWWGHKIPLEGEEDVLDTWFSSSLWPISVFGWPKETADLKYFYPTTVRETGYDILFFWVTREIMMCLQMTGQIPFEIVYLHGLVRDEKGRKFSKTAGIGFDPLEVIQKYGADALRLALVFGTAAGNDLSVGEDKIRAMRNFANKVWNIGRYLLGHLEEKGLSRYEDLAEYQPEMAGLKAADRQIIEEFDKTVADITQAIEEFRFGLASEQIYEFLWHRLADWYIEGTKERVKAGETTPLSVLRYTYLNCLKLLHPFMPFVTETIWQQFPKKDNQPLIVSSWPTPL
jgi:valyl-tRNA synthetase